ncbi:MAG: undecaprenyl-diphosphatase [Micavibrio aeruginosavorus]|uniref:Undecaprenyl-diphosphatase n=1 Tax=Micavibrio aeruginosavorus TaxID=349221 RepID=A0A2W5FLP3_9BACT|nr:MAG: undecaprenyl-diphosphatase [Micavibrio aeruginosavorus]
MLDNIIDSIILGIVEGLTEFIPVSSTGHLILTESILNRHHETAGVFDVFIQVGAILAVVWARRMRILKMAIGLPNERAEQLLAAKIIIAFIPAAIAGFFLHGFIKEVLFSPWVVAIGLIVGGIFMLFAERLSKPPMITNMESMSLKMALGVGLCQVAALIPGISRAGASIVGARMLGVEMRTAAEFSFFLAIPTIFGAAAFDMYQNWDIVSASDLPWFALGTIAAFFSALIVVNWMINFVGKHGFKPFGYYRIVVGIIVLIFLSLGYIN